VTQLREEVQGATLKELCALFGRTRNAWYDHQQHLKQDVMIRDIVLQEVYKIRQPLPALGTRKLHMLIKQPLLEHKISIGRDYLFELLASKGLLIRRRKRRAITTDSNHWMRKYDNLIKEMVIIRAEQLWVSDITYLRLGNIFVYLSLVTDAYSRKIVGYHLQQDLTAQGCMHALELALRTRKRLYKDLVHHSDRGSQYCCKAYVEMLHNDKIAISMTQNGDPYENAIAERINGILKSEFDIEINTGSWQQLQDKLDGVIIAYNTLRPHDSCNGLTPEQAHLKQGILNKKWKNYKKEKWIRKNKEIEQAISILA